MMLERTCRLTLAANTGATLPSRPNGYSATGAAFAPLPRRAAAGTDPHGSLCRHDQYSHDGVWSKAGKGAGLPRRVVYGCGQNNLAAHSMPLRQGS